MDSGCDATARPHLSLTTFELREIVLALVSLGRRDALPTATAGALIPRLMAALSPLVAESLGTLVSRLDVQATRPTPEKATPEMLSDIERAMHERRLLRLGIRPPGGPQVGCILEPERLRIDSDRWTLLGWDRDLRAYRTCRLDHLVHTRVLNARIVPESINRARPPIPQP